MFGEARVLMLSEVDLVFFVPCYAVTQALLRRALRGSFDKAKARHQNRVDSVARSGLKLCDKAKNKASGCGAVGSALPWGGRGRWFKSSHSDQITPMSICSLALFHLCDSF